MKKRKNYTFIVAASICMFLLLIVIAGNFGGKGTRAEGENSECNGSYSSAVDDYCCDNGTKQITNSTDIEIIKRLSAPRIGKIVALSDGKYYRIFNGNANADEPFYIVNTCVKKESISGNSNNNSGKQKVDNPACDNNIYYAGGQEINLLNYVQYDDSKIKLTSENNTYTDPGIYHLYFEIKEEYQSGYQFNNDSNSFHLSCKIIDNREELNVPKCNDSEFDEIGKDGIDFTKKLESYNNNNIRIKTSEDGLSGSAPGSYSIEFEIKDKTKNIFKVGNEIKYTKSTICKILNAKHCSVSLSEIPSTITAGTSVSVTATTTLNEGLTVQSYKWSTGGTAFDSSSSGNLTHEGHKLSDNISFKTLNKNGTLGVGVTVTLSDNSTCSKSIEFNVGDMGDNLVTIKFMNGDTLVDTKTCKTENNVSGDYELCLKGISTPGPQTKTGFYFKGWGSEKDCTSSSLPSNYYLTPRVSATYYACFDNTNPDGPNPKDIDKKRCSISFETPVVNDRRYLNCKYVGVSYGTSADDGVNIDQGVTRRDVIRTCCEYKGYTWIGENYGPQGGEYCIKCSGKPSPSSPSPSSPSPSNKNPTSNPPTGATLIFVVWSIGLAMTVYAFWYFKSQYNN